MRIYKIKRGTPNPIDGSALYVGIDVHQVTWHITIMDGEKVLRSISIPGEWEVLRKLLDRYRGYRIYTVYEAGYFGYGLYDRLIEYGVACIVAAPSLIPREYGNRVKTDRIDSAKLALYLMQNNHTAVVVPTEEERSHRTVIRRRHQLVKDSVRIQLRIKAELRFYSIPFPAVHGKWSKIFIENLHNLQFKDRWLRESFARLLAQYEHLNEELAKQRALVEELSKTDRYRDQVKILQTIPGIGVLTAMEMLVELQDIRRFRTADQLAAYVGLTPSQYSSGDHVRMGRITRIGKGQLRALLVEAAWVLIKKDPIMGQTYQSLKNRRGSKKAIVAIGRKLLVRARRVLLDRTPYVVGKVA